MSRKARFVVVDVTSDFTGQLILEWDAKSHHPASSDGNQVTPPMVTFSTWLSQMFAATGAWTPLWITHLQTNNPIPPYFQQIGAWNCSGNCICFLLLHLPPGEAPETLSFPNMRPWVTWSYLMADPALRRLLEVPSNWNYCMLLHYQPNFVWIDLFFCCVRPENTNPTMNSWLTLFLPVTVTHLSYNIIGEMSTSEIREGDVFVIQPYRFKGHLFARQLNKSSWVPKEQSQALLKVSEKDFGLGMVPQPLEEFSLFVNCRSSMERPVGWLGRWKLGRVNTLLD